MDCLCFGCILLLSSLFWAVFILSLADLAWENKGKGENWLEPDGDIDHEQWRI